MLPRARRPPTAPRAGDAPDLAPRPAGRIARLLRTRADAPVPRPPPRLTDEGGAMEAASRPPPPPPPSAADARNEVLALVALLPPAVASTLAARPDLDTVLEVIMDVGRPPLARLPSGDVELSAARVTPSDLAAAVARLGDFGEDNRAGVDRTLHRVSALRNRAGGVVGLTARVGRAVRGSAAPVADAALAGASVLLLGRPGVGKTTAIRELARLLADEAGRRVVVVDTSNEIGGDGDVPHPALGGARRMMVAGYETQHRVMIEAVENHMPQTVVVDEIGTDADAAAARTIAQRGVQLIATAHGGCLDNLVANPALSDLVGGVATVTLGDDEARRRGGRKSVRERASPPTFDVAVEMVDTAVWRVHMDLAAAADAVLRGEDPRGELRVRAPGGRVVALPPHATLADAAAVAAGGPAPGEAGGLDDPGAQPGAAVGAAAAAAFPAALPPALPDTAPGPGLQARGGADGGGGGALRVYAYGLPDADVASAAAAAGLASDISIAPRLDAADVVLALRARARASPRLRADAAAAALPVYAVKAASPDALARALRALLGIDSTAGGLFGGDEEGGEARAGGAGGPRAHTPLARPPPDAPPPPCDGAVAEALAALRAVVLPCRQPCELAPAGGAARAAQAAAAAAEGCAVEEVGAGASTRLRILPPPLAA